jgi:hypothetical protein
MNQLMQFWTNPKGTGKNTINRKFTVKNKRESDSLIVYNDDYKDQYPKKRNTMATKARISASSKAAKNSKHDGRTSSRKAIKSHTGHKLSHKRSQSLHRSNNGDQRYRSVPQNGYNNEIDNRKSYTKSKHDQMKIEYFIS